MNLLSKMPLLILVFSLFMVSCKKEPVPHDKEIEVVLAPNDNPSEVHIFGNQKSDQSDPNSPELVAGTGTYFGETVKLRAAVKFDMSELPRKAKVVSARLSLYSNPTPLNGQEGVANSGISNATQVRRITKSWEAHLVSWQSQPQSTVEDMAIIPHENAGFKDIENLDVTRMVQTMVAEGKNHGFMIQLEKEEVYNFRVFCSSKYVDSSKHPRLTIVFKLK